MFITKTVTRKTACHLKPHLTCCHGLSNIITNFIQERTRLTILYDWVMNTCNIVKEYFWWQIIHMFEPQVKLKIQNNWRNQLSMGSFLIAAILHEHVDSVVRKRKVVSTHIEINFRRTCCNSGLSHLPCIYAVSFASLRSLTEPLSIKHSLMVESFLLGS